MEHHKPKPRMESRIIWGFHYSNPDRFHIFPHFWWDTHQPSFQLVLKNFCPWTPRRALERSGRQCRDKCPDAVKCFLGTNGQCFLPKMVVSFLLSCVFCHIICKLYGIGGQFLATWQFHTQIATWYMEIWCFGVFIRSQLSGITTLLGEVLFNWYHTTGCPWKIHMARHKINDVQGILMERWSSWEWWTESEIPTGLHSYVPVTSSAISMSQGEKNSPEIRHIDGQRIAELNQGEWKIEYIPKRGAS